MMQVLTLFCIIAIEFLLCVFKDHEVSALTFGGATVRANETFFIGENCGCWGHLNHEGQHFRGRNIFGGHNNFKSRKSFPHQNQDGGHLTQNPNGHRQNTPWCPRNLLLIGVLVYMGRIIIFGKATCWILLNKIPHKILAFGVRDAKNGLSKLKVSTLHKFQHKPLSLFYN
jgi:hypothetical protein